MELLSPKMYCRYRLSNNTLQRSINVIKSAQRVLGSLEPGQLSDLLLDNISSIPSSAESHAILYVLYGYFKDDGIQIVD